MNLFKRKKQNGWRGHRKQFPTQNKGGLDEWSRRCPEKYKDDVLEFAERYPHTCLTCWWLQFKEGRHNRGCRFTEYTGEKIPFRSIPEALTWNCLAWRVDPCADMRVQGFQGFIM